jgi:hypothetical protein
VDYANFAQRLETCEGYLEHLPRLLVAHPVGHGPHYFKYSMSATTRAPCARSAPVNQAMTVVVCFASASSRSDFVTSGRELGERFGDAFGLLAGKASALEFLHDGIGIEDQCLHMRAVYHAPLSKRGKGIGAVDVTIVSSYADRTQLR